MKRLPRFCLRAALLLPVLSSCTYAPPGTALFGPKAAAVSERQGIDRNLRKGAYPEALALIDGERRRGASKSLVAKDYLAAVAGSLKSAAAAQAEDDYRGAGLLYRAILDYYPANLPLDQELKTSRHSIELNLRFCSDRLMEQGLHAYRRGDLDGAIGAWSQLLDFDPGHEPAGNALATAVRQRDALRTLEKVSRP
ncbi:hypothetical protein DSOUD_3510 [Desulfuromonas soudanensis]|uniref:Tetratricopeptide repeat protein n=1 Tax=Desulfuromonas soudanensis TaxID=1603606 RepID=A0A0M5IWM8_9BACT|nr:hypothetical protein [Desulfuromonas soudanensis]ALC18224.1 hypothetical protein DSOUD_3510 [Desulfuromonas soudanensis]